MDSNAAFDELSDLLSSVSSGADKGGTRLDLIARTILVVGGMRERIRELEEEKEEKEGEEGEEEEKDQEDQEDQEES